MPNHLYGLIGISSEAEGPESGISSFTVTSGLRHAAGLRIATLGLAAEHGAASFAFADVMAVPVSIAVSQRSAVDEGQEMILASRMRHRGRSLLVTAMEAFRAGDRSSVVGFGTITWSVISATPPARRAAAALPQPEPGATLFSIAGISGPSGLRAIPSSEASVSGPGGILHAGALQTLIEQAALDAGAEAGLDPATSLVADASFQFLRGGRQGPFVAKARLLTASGHGCDVEVQVFEDDGAGKLCASCIARVTSF